MAARAGASTRAKGKKTAAQPALDEARVIEMGGLNTHIGYQIRRVNARSVALWDDLLSGRGVAWGQYSILKILTVNPGLVQKEIAAIAGVDQTTVVPVLKHLEKAGLIERTRGAKDGRNVYVAATPLGIKLLSRVDSLVLVHDRELTVNLTREERVTLLGLLAKVSGLAAGPLEDPET